jgi:hypothetical protein
MPALMAPCISCVCVRACVNEWCIMCVSERDREREREGGREGGRERQSLQHLSGSLLQHLCRLFQHLPVIYFRHCSPTHTQTHTHTSPGNRVTCRDWFQLTLKEGLTVFRDQQFSAAMTSTAVKRIEDVTIVRALQFPEDRGPMRHPIRPETYIAMDNFYTATVYRKGAEVIRMYQTLLGADGFRKGMDLYFQRHDGQVPCARGWVGAVCVRACVRVSGCACALPVYKTRIVSVYRISVASATVGDHRIPYPKTPPRNPTLRTWHPTPQAPTSPPYVDAATSRR